MLVREKKSTKKRKAETPLAKKVVHRNQRPEQPAESEQSEDIELEISAATSQGITQSSLPPLPDASGDANVAAADLQEATSPAPTAGRAEDSIASPPTPARRAAQNGATSPAPEQAVTPRRARAAGGARRGIANGSANGDVAVDIAADGAGAAEATASDMAVAGGAAAGRARARTGSDANGSASRGALQAADKQEPQAAPALAWGTAGGVLAADARDLVLQRLLRQRSAAAHAMPIRPQLQAVHDRLLQTLKETTERLGQNRSLLLIGPHGCGKTLVIERAVAELQRQCNSDPTNPTVGVVRLSGLLHTEERVAFREIARQLCTEFRLKEEFSRTASVEENITFLRDLARQLRRVHKVVVFVLEDFDRFTAKRQAVLYNMLDTMHGPDMQAALVGTTQRKDVVDLLEKRIRSRFSHRRLLLGDPLIDAAPSGAAGTPLGVLAAMLRLPTAGGATPQHDAYAVRFNDAVDEALAAPEAAAALARHFYWDIGTPATTSGASPAELAALAIRIADDLEPPDGLPEGGHVVAAVEAQDAAEYSQAQAIVSLSVAELFMLVAAQRIHRRSQSPLEGVNFEAVWEEYDRLRQLRGHADHYSRTVVARAFEALLARRLLTHADPRAERRGGMREFQPAELQVTQAEIEMGLRAHPHVPGLLLDWLQKEAVGGNAILLGDE